MYYVYILFRPDGRPFYVGKGQRNRMHQHEVEARKGHDCYKCNTIRKIWSEGGSVFKTKVFETHDEADAYQMEARVISAIGLDLLANVKEGGIPESMRAYVRQPAEWVEWLARHVTKPVSPEEARETHARAMIAQLSWLIHQRRYWYQSRLEPEQVAALDNEIDAYRVAICPLVYTKYRHYRQEGFEF